MDVNYKLSDRAYAFLSEHLPEALQAESSYKALCMLYELIDDKGFEAPKYEKLNDFGLAADAVYDEIYEMNMQQNVRRIKLLRTFILLC